MKKLWVIAGGIGISLSLFACGKVESHLNGKETIVDRNADTLAYQSATSLSLIFNRQSDGRKMKIDGNTKLRIEEMLPSVDLILKNEAEFSNQILESDREGYAYKQEISYKDLTDARSEYTLYYNIVGTKEEIDEDETETETELSGIAVAGESEFDFVGSIEKETEADEQEEEMDLKIFTEKGNSRSYVKVKQEISRETDEYEEEFAYEIVENGVTIYAFSFEKETERQKVENEIKVKMEGVKYKFETFTENGEEFIRVKVDGSETETVLFRKVVTETDGVSTATFEEVIGNDVK